MRYAIIDNGVCINAAATDDPAFANNLGWLVLPDGFGKGDLFDGTTWTKAPPIDVAALDLATLNAALAQPGSVVRALALVLLQEINTLRTKTGLATYTQAQLVSALQAKMR